jgi:hypothetical protein
MNDTDPTIGRYQWHEAGSVRFFLEDYTPDDEECKFLLLKVIEQAVRDFISFADSTEPELVEICLEARSFLFDDDYYIDWGEQELNLATIMDILDIDIEWFRSKTRQKLLLKEVS